MAHPVLGGYEIIRRVGSGGMAEVFEAHRVGYSGFHQRVALKCILPRLAADPRFVQQFINEAHLGSRLHHPNIVAVQDFNQVEGVLYLAMEFVEGTDLDALMTHYRRKGEPIPTDLVVYVLVNVLEGLGAAHTAVGEQGEPLSIIHRDVKPLNIMLTRQGGVKIADFGIAKAARTIHQVHTSDMLRGSLGYMSPEQVTGQPLTLASDLFSVGVLVYEMLMLEPLFGGEPVRDVVFRIMTVDVQEELARLEVAHPSFHAIAARALSLDPSARFKSAFEFRDALKPLGDLAAGQELCRAAAKEILQSDGPSRRDLETDVWSSRVFGERLGTLSGAEGSLRGSWDNDIPSSEEDTPIAPHAPPSAPPVVDVVQRASPSARSRWRPVIWGLGGIAAAVVIAHIWDVGLRDRLLGPDIPPPADAVEPGQARWHRGSEMVEVLAGSFRTGAGEAVAWVDTFWIDRFEVTTGQYLDFLADCPVGKPCGPKEIPAWLRLARPADLLAVEALPITSVSWEEAAAFCAWAGKRLPTTHEWEKAARGVDGRAFPWGDTWEADRAWINAPRYLERERVLAQLPDSVIDPRWREDISPLGVRGMAGNVSEWTSDPDPANPAFRLVAGGSFEPGPPDVAKVVRRFGMAAADRTNSVGMRCAASEVPDSPGAQLTLDRIRSTGELRMGAEVSEPMLTRDDAGRYDGFDLQLTTRLAESLGARLTVVEGKYARLPGMLAAGSFDVIVSGYIPDPAIHGVNWSRPYLDSGLSMIVKKGSKLRSVKQLAGARVGIFNDLAAERALSALLPGATLARFDDGYLDALAQGYVDAVVYDAPFAVAEVAGYTNTTLEIVAWNVTRYSYAMGVRRGEYTWQEKLDESIAGLRAQPTYLGLIEHWFGGSYAIGTMGAWPGRMAQVRPGDTLRSLAERELGSPEREAELWELNKAWLGEPSRLQEGIYVKLPEQ